MAEGEDLSKTLSGGSEELFDLCCSPCSEDGKSKEAEKYCKDCEMYICTQCLKDHKKFPTTRAHHIVDKSEPNKSGHNTDSTQAVLPTDMCMNHNGKLKDMYCADHEVICCAVCIAVNHRTCVKVDYLPDVARGIKDSQEFKDVKGMLHTVHSELNGEQTKRKDNISSLENENENILAEINQHEDDLISKIRVLSQTTRETLNSKFSEGRKTLEEDIENITTAMTTISLQKENISSGNETKIFAKVKHGKIAVEDCKVLLRDLSGRSYRKMLCFVANNKLKSEVNASEFIGTVHTLEDKKTEEDLKINSKEQKTDSSNIDFKKVIQEEKLKVEVSEEKKKEEDVKNNSKEQNTDSSNIDFKEVIKEEKFKVEVSEEKIEREMLQYTATFSGMYTVNDSPCVITAACVLDNKSLMLFDNTNGVLKRLGMGDFKIIDQLQLEGFISYSICSVGTEEVAVALLLDKKIQFVSIGRTLALTRSFNTEHYSHGVTYNEVSGEFYVSNESNKLIVYDKNGKLMKTYEKDGQGRSMFSATRNLTWSEDKTVLYVTDRYEGLLALSMSGDLLWTFTDSELKYAHGLCVLPGDVILVSGVDSNNVIQVDKRGKKIGTLLGAGDNLINPWTLAYDRNTFRLFVGHYSNEIHVNNLVKK